MSMLHFVAILDKGDNWSNLHIDNNGAIYSDDKAQLPIVHRHFEYVDRLISNGIMLTGGPIPALDRNELKDTLSLEGAVFVYVADSLIEVQKILDDDPLVKEDIIKVRSIYPFIIGLSS